MRRQSIRAIAEVALSVSLILGACQAKPDQEIDSTNAQTDEEVEGRVQDDESFRAAVEPECVRAGGDVEAPRRIQYVPLEFTPDPTVHTQQQFLMYDVVIDRGGRISSVQLARPFREVPPWPAIHQSALEAIRQWQYEPTLVDGKAVAVCMMVTVTAEWR